MKDMNLPLTLGAVGFDGTEESEKALAEYLIANTNIDPDSEMELLLQSIAAIKD